MPLKPAFKNNMLLLWQAYSPWIPDRKLSGPGTAEWRREMPWESCPWNGQGSHKWIWIGFNWFEYLTPILLDQDMSSFLLLQTSARQYWIGMVRATRGSQVVQSSTAISGRSVCPCPHQYRKYRYHIWEPRKWRGNYMNPSPLASYRLNFRQCFDGELTLVLSSSGVAPGHGGPESQKDRTHHVTDHVSRRVCWDIFHEGS